MTEPPPGSKDLEVIYAQRFNAHIAYRNKVWKVLTSNYFRRYIDIGAAVLDLGCGYGEFINNVACRQKFAMDLNPVSGQHLAPGVHFYEQDCSRRWAIPDGTLDVVFSSNFFEHLPSKDALRDTLAEAWRCLQKGGRILLVGPNIRFVGGAYWDFWDHHLALTELSIAEALQIQGFHLEEVIDRFLPYTMVNRRYAPIILIWLYLRIPIAWRIFGKQFLVVAQKPA